METTKVWRAGVIFSKPKISGRVEIRTSPGSLTKWGREGLPDLVTKR
jgi:hypothetical protein